MKKYQVKIGDFTFETKAKNTLNAKAKVCAENGLNPFLNMPHAEVKHISAS